jgi:hypothetical protein
LYRLVICGHLQVGKLHGVGPVHASVRLLGVTVSGLVNVEGVPPEAGQMNLLEEVVDFLR